MKTIATQSDLSSEPIAEGCHQPADLRYSSTLHGGQLQPENRFPFILPIFVSPHAPFFFPLKFTPIPSLSKTKKGGTYVMGFPTS